MKKLRFFIFGFFGFLIVTTFNVSIAVMFYSMIEYKTEIQIATLMIVLILLNTLWCSIFDVFRRKIMVDKPVKEILNATKAMTKGDFNVKLIPTHSYDNYDEFDEIKEDLNKMASELSQNEMLKNDFISNVSHEIKTPLSVIKGYAKALENNSLDESTKKEYVAKMQNACEKLNALVTNILKLNKLENQKLIPEITRFNLSETLVNQILLFEELIDSKNINLNCEIEENLYINSEQSYLELVFNNLLSNAIKFTSSNGSIEVKLNKIEEEYVIVFKDSGCGMDNNTGKHIFDKFYQGDTSHKTNGNGLGLALVKRVIDILGGKISVESELGVGSTFIVVIKEVSNG